MNIQYTDTKSGVGGFLAGLAMGALIAGVAALLYAPHRGSETREMVKHRSLLARDRIVSRAREAAQAASYDSHRV